MGLFWTYPRDVYPAHSPQGSSDWWSVNKVILVVRHYMSCEYHFMKEMIASAKGADMHGDLVLSRS